MRQVVKSLPADVVALDEVDLGQIFAIEWHGTVYVLRENSEGADFSTLEADASCLEEGADPYDLLERVILDGYEVFEFSSRREFARWMLGEGEQKQPNEALIDRFGSVGLFNSKNRISHIIRRITFLETGKMRVATVCGVRKVFESEESLTRLTRQWHVTEEALTPKGTGCFRCSFNIDGSLHTVAVVAGALDGPGKVVRSFEAFKNRGIWSRR